MSWARVQRRLIALFAALLTTLLTACGSMPPTHYYVLAPPDFGAAPAAAGGLRLGVEVFVVDPPYDQDRLVYRLGRDAVEVGFYQQHRWAAPTGRLVATALATALRGLGGAADVEPVTARGDYDLRLAGRVVALEEVDLPGSQLARLQLDLKLLDAGGEVLWSRWVEAEVEGRAEDVGTILRQMQAAFEDVVRQIRTELEAVLAE